MMFLVCVIVFVSAMISKISRSLLFVIRIYQIGYDQCVAKADSSSLKSEMTEIKQKIGKNLSWSLNHKIISKL